MAGNRSLMSTDAPPHASIPRLTACLAFYLASLGAQAAPLRTEATPHLPASPTAGADERGSGSSMPHTPGAWHPTVSPTHPRRHEQTPLPPTPGAWHPTVSPTSTPIPAEFMLGTQWQDGATTARFLNELGLHWARGTISINQVIPTLEDPTLTLEDVENSPWMIDDLLDYTDWSGVDGQLRPMIDAGIQLIPALGLGWIGTYATIEGENATPDRLGADTYLAYYYLYSRAVVERYDGDGYKDADGMVIKYWQIENELNQAMFTTLYGWREPTGTAGLTSLWADWDFLTTLLDTLNRAVHDSDPTALTTQNLHTDIPPEYNRLFGLPGWPAAAFQWRNSMDIVGFDAYPNYYYADPINSDTVGERVDMLQELSGGKPVIIMESGYPAGPLELGYTEEKQAQYLVDSVHSAVDAGAIGYIHFKLTSTYQPSIEVTEQDKENLELIGQLFEDGHVLALLAWIALHEDEIPHMIEVLQAVEPFWGMVDPAGNRKLSFYAMQELAEELNGASACSSDAPVRQTAGLKSARP